MYLGIHSSLFFCLTYSRKMTKSLIYFTMIFKAGPQGYSNYYNLVHFPYPQELDPDFSVMV